MLGSDRRSAARTAPASPLRDSQGPAARGGLQGGPHGVPMLPPHGDPGTGVNPIWPSWPWWARSPTGPPRVTAPGVLAGGECPSDPPTPPHSPPRTPNFLVVATGSGRAEIPAPIFQSGGGRERGAMRWGGQQGCPPPKKKKPLWFRGGHRTPVEVSTEPPLSQAVNPAPQNKLDLPSTRINSRGGVLPRGTGGVPIPIPQHGAALPHPLGAPYRRLALPAARPDSM